MVQELLDSPQKTINKNTSEFLMYGTANDLCCDDSVSDSFYDIIGEVIVIVIVSLLNLQPVALPI